MVERVVVTPAAQPPARAPRHGDWLAVLQELAHQLDRGLLYDRNLLAVASALDEVLTAFRRRVRRG